MMFYEETVVNGILMFRTTPDGEWHQVSVEKMTDVIVKLRAELAEKEEKILKFSNLYNMNSDYKIVIINDKADIAQLSEVMIDGLKEYKLSDFIVPSFPDQPVVKEPKPWSKKHKSKYHI